MKRSYVVVIVAMVALVLSSAVRAQDADKDAISGTMDIKFNTRTQLDDSGDLKANSAKLGVQDEYTFQLAVAKTTLFSGKITRQPNLFSKIIAKKKQEAQIAFDTNIAVLNPTNLAQKKEVGKWVGVVPIDTASGAYVLDGGRKAGIERPLRIHVDPIGSVQAFDDPFTGRLMGKAEKKEGLAAYTYKRFVGTKEVTVTVKKADPMRFEGIELAKGPVGSYPRAIVNGRLDYDYETGNWLTDGIRFKYSVDGKEFEDVVTGTIKWVEDANRKSNGRGQYEFNLRFNEEKNRKTSTEGSAFEKMKDEEAFFAVDNSIPSLTGTVAYVDTMVGDTVSASKITYKLEANKLTKQQVMNFFKLWMVCVGPTNDE